MTNVTFLDTTTGFTATKIYNFPITTTQAAATTQITADGTAFKNGIATASTLQAKVGTVITI